jgi:preprotein translocase subunit SecA
MKLLNNIFGSRNSRLIKQYKKTILKINALEDTLKKLSDEELSAHTDIFKQRLNDSKNPATLDDLLPEAFAVCREAAVRVLKMRHYDVQLIGGIVLHNGKIAEMSTGEGKTLVATLPVYLNALTGDGVHVVTVNDYLARRDAESMGQIYKFLGLSVGIVHSEQNYEEKKIAYQADVVYATNNELGFDYLRDNMVFNRKEQRQRNHCFAIVDEVDSILIDEARTPLIISGATDDNIEVYPIIDTIPNKLTCQIGEINKEGIPSENFKAGDYTVDEKSKQVYLTDQGHEKVEKMLNQKGLLPDNASLYDARYISLNQYVNASIRAHLLYEKNVDYIIEENEVVIIDEFTGRKMSGRRWSDGLHQAIEAKEKVAIQSENQTLASITFQNYFRLYDKLAGMTGTANTEAVELQQIYKLEVIVIPTNKPIIREDCADVIYLTMQEKFQAIADEIQEVQKNGGRPILVGTASIDSSEKLSSMLTKANVKHELLNAKQHLREAFIIAQAGRINSVTIATNMAGRGTDIVLGGNITATIEKIEDISEEKYQELQKEWEIEHKKVLELGGLYVIGTERNESRRVDNQLRGRSGRQGDPGMSRFYLSLEDDLMRIFASDRMRTMMQKLGLEHGESIQHSMVSKAIENAQSKVEGRNYEMRKQLLEYDDVINEQRKLVYKQRDQLISDEDISKIIEEMRESVFEGIISEYIPTGSLEEQWDIEGLEMLLKNDFSLDLPLQQWLDEDSLLNEDSLRKKIIEASVTQYNEKEILAGKEQLREFEKAVLLQLLDHLWKEHIASLDYLRQGIHLRGYAQKNPVQEYKREAFEMFQEFLFNLRRDVIKLLSQVKISQDYEAPEFDQPRDENYNFHHEASESLFANNPLSESPQNSSTSFSNATQQQEPEKEQPYIRKDPKIGRNDPCYCNSGKKYKHCHGKT